MHLNARSNEYADAAGELLDVIPKAVWAALAVSALTIGGDRLAEVKTLIVREWSVLYTNGIVPQPVPGKLKHLVEAK